MAEGGGRAMQISNHTYIEEIVEGVVEGFLDGAPAQASKLADRALTVEEIRLNPSTFSDTVCEGVWEWTGSKMCSPCGLPESRGTDCQRRCV
jgi:hypothetical protein